MLRLASIMFADKFEVSVSTTKQFLNTHSLVQMDLSTKYVRLKIKYVLDSNERNCPSLKD